MPTSSLEIDRAAEAARVWNVPYPRDPNFIGRDQVLELLARALESPDPAAKVQAIYGLGGVGKTRLAAEYAHRRRNDYRLVWWVRADDADTLRQGIGELAARLGVRHAADALPGEIYLHLQRRLDELAPWLLIFDNASGPDELEPYLPERSSGHVIVTSRNPNCRGVGQSLNLPVLHRRDAVDLLVRRSGRSDADGTAAKVAHALGDLPLALVQAAATVEQTGIDFSGYLSRFEDFWGDLLQSGRTSAGRHPDGVAMTWELAFRQVADTDPDATALLNVCAFLGPSDIPRSLLRDGADLLPGPLGRALKSPIRLDTLLAILLRHSLVEPRESTVSVHRVVAGLTRDRLTPEWRAHWCERALELVAGAFKFDDDPLAWAGLGPMVPHALAVAGHAEQLDVAQWKASKLLNEAGQLFLATGRYDEARRALERALTLCTNVHGQINPRRSAIANNLGRALNRLGKRRLAREHFEEALSLDSAAYGERHPHAAESANNVGTALHLAGDVEGARRHFEWALEVCREYYGPEHAKVAAVTNNLAYSMVGAGDVERALDHFRRALVLAESTRGPSHPDVAQIASNLGIALHLKGQSGEARRLLERAVSVAEGSVGRDHPDVARHLSRLGLLLMDQSAAAAARVHLERALKIDERALGAHHPNLVERINSLGRCLKQLGDLDGCTACYERAAAISAAARRAEQEGDDEEDDEVRPVRASRDGSVF